MQVSKLMAAVLAATVCTTPYAQHFTASGASASSAMVSVALPFSLVAVASITVGASLSSLSDHSRWRVTDLKERPGGQNDAQMQSDDGKYKLNMTVPAPTVRDQHLAVGDTVDIDRVGDAGYVVKKGAATIGVLAQPAMAHSKART